MFIIKAVTWSLGSKLCTLESMFCDFCFAAWSRKKTKRKKNCKYEWTKKIQRGIAMTNRSLKLLYTLKNFSLFFAIAVMSDCAINLLIVWWPFFLILWPQPSISPCRKGSAPLCLCYFIVWFCLRYQDHNAMKRKKKKNIGSNTPCQNRLFLSKIKHNITSCLLKMSLSSEVVFWGLI